MADIVIEQHATIRPFDSGSQYVDWTACNCDRCTKSTYNEAKTPCDLEYALLAACFGDGEITADIAQRCGLNDNAGGYVWPCTEVEWTVAWQEEYKRRHPEKFA